MTKLWSSDLFLKLFLVQFYHCHSLIGRAYCFFLSGIAERWDFLHFKLPPGCFWYTWFTFILACLLVVGEVSGSSSAQTETSKIVPSAVMYDSRH